VRFYTAGAGLTRLGGFEDHAGLRYRARERTAGRPVGRPGVSERYGAARDRIMTNVEHLVADPTAGR